MTLQALIDKQDTFEIIRDQIAALLTLEIANQMAIAAGTPGKDPEDWNVAVYSERSHPWEMVLNDVDIPRMWVNVWWDASNFEAGASDVIKKQRSSTTYNVDCYGYAPASDDPQGGHNPGDKAAALIMQRCVRLVRNILMAGENAYLQLPRGTVGIRWTNSITSFQPQMDTNSVQQPVAARLSFRVEFEEFSPQYVGEPLELLTAQVQRAEDGEIVIDSSFDYTAP